jgi:hypothetical protein
VSVVKEVKMVNRKMVKKIFGSFILCLMVFSPVVLSASSQSEALVEQGRALLFKDGNATWQGVIDANKKFAEAVKKDNTDQHAHLFYAVTRIAAFVLENGDGSSFQTLADIIQAMGIPIHLDGWIDEEAPFGSPPEIAGKYAPPPGTPDGDAVRDVLGDKLVAVIDQALASLDAVDAEIDVTLTAQELGDMTGLEIDYTDVLLAKGVLDLLKAVFLVITAYDLDAVDIREMIALANADMWELHPDFLNLFLTRHPDFLKMADTGIAGLAAAKNALLSAHDNFLAAKNALELETDNQDNDLFVFESEGDKQEFEGFVNALSELADSLKENRPATIQYSEYFFDITVDNQDQLSLYLEEDVFGNQTRWRSESDFWGTIGHDHVYGNVVFWDIDPDNNATIILDYWGYKRIVLTGQLDSNKTTINGTCTYEAFDGFTYQTVSSAPFSATLSYQQTDDMEKFDLNALFGNTGKSPLVLRDVLPQFDRFGEPIAGTFPEPVFNGIFPDMSTNDAVAAGMELDPPYKVFTIPDVTIVLDGDKSDWPASARVAEANEDEFMDGWNDVQGMDMTKVYLAKDSQYLYMATELADNPIEPAEDGSTPVYYTVELEKDNETSWYKNFRVQAYYAPWNSRWQIDINTGNGSGNEPFSIPEGEIYVGAGDAFLEWKIPLSEVGDLAALGGRWIGFGTWWSDIHNGDWIHTNARLAPVFTITGSVDVPDGYTGGNIYYYLSENEWPPPGGNTVAGTYVDSDGAFTLTDVPYSSTDMFLHVFWDKDGNGIPTSGDYTGMIAFDVQGAVDLGTIELNEPVAGLPLEAVSVKHVTHGDGVSETYFDIMIGSSFTGTLPDDIHRITVTGPDGTHYPIWPDGENVSWLGFDNTFFAIVPGTPALGEYTFVVTGRDGSVGIKTDTQKDIFIIPVVDADTVKIDTGSKTPVFSWDPVRVPGTDLTYRLEIREVGTDFYFRSGRGWGMTACTGPELAPGKQYQYRIRAMDHSNWVQVDNRSHTDWIPFTMNNTLDHSSVPAIDTENWGAVKWSHEGTSPSLDLWVKVIDHDGVAHDGSSHYVYARPVDADGNLIGSDVIQLYRNDVRNVFEVYYSRWINNPDQLPEGTQGIQFSVEDPAGNQGSVIDMITGVPMVRPEDIALTCTVNGTTSPTFSWNKVQGANHYRIRVFDENRNTVLRWTVGNQTETTIPPGYLMPGTTYQYRLEARNAHMGFDIDETFAFPPRDASGNYPQFTTGTVSDVPFIDVNNNGVFTWNRDHLGPVTNFWVKVYDAQGVDNIQRVKVIHPDETTETELYVEYIESGNCAVFSNNTHDEAGPQSGTYTFIAVDKDGNQSVPVTESLTVNSMGYPDHASLRVTVTEDTGAEFAWKLVDGAAFYRVEIYDRHLNRIYVFSVTENQYSLAPGFLKQGEVYGFRVTTRREFFDQNVDNASTSPWSTYDLVTFKTGPAEKGGTSHPEIDTDNFGAAVTYLTHPVTGQPLYWVQFSVQVSDADGVPGNIKSVTVEGPGITESLPLMFVGRGGQTAEYWARMVYDSYDDIPEGEYTFRVEDEDDNIAETTDVLTKKPVPPAANMTPVGGSIVTADRPVIAWDAPANGPWFYRVKILQHWEKTIHDSGIITENRYVVPGHVLQSGEIYHYWVYIYDGDMKTLDVDNLSMQGVFSSDFTRFDVSETPRQKGLSDVVRLLKILMGQTAEFSSFDLDMNDNRQLDMQDAIPVLQEAGDMR